jgi:hypothetical protein
MRAGFPQVNLPGLSATPAEMLAALERAAARGPEIASFVSSTSR